MEFDDNKDRQRKATARGPQKAPPSDQKGKRAPGVGDALRSVYQRTIDEEIPPEMLDLLGKLG